MSWMNHNITGSKQEIYVPKNQNKFLGTQMICRSSWELRLAKYFDCNQNIIRWSSEQLEILYYDPIKRKQRRYYPDFLIQTINNEIFVIEVKPEAQTKQPKMKQNKKTYLKESMQYFTNLAKWQAADIYCQNRGFKFKILTEKSLPL